MRKKILDALARRLTVLIIPQTQMKPWRWQCSTGFFLFWLGLWSAMRCPARLPRPGRLKVRHRRPIFHDASWKLLKETACVRRSVGWTE